MSIRYSRTAQHQLDQLEATASDELWDGIVDTIDRIAYDVLLAKKAALPFTGDDGQFWVQPVPGQSPWKVMWRDREGDLWIEAVFSYPYL